MTLSKRTHLNSHDEIDDYINRINRRAKLPHAKNVRSVVKMLANAVQARVDFSNDDKVEVYTRVGKPVYACWVTISGKKYSFKFNRTTDKIDIRKVTWNGDLVEEFDNATPDLANLIRTTVKSL